MDEFEDAMGDTFANFLRNFPHIELQADAKYTGGEVFRVRTHFENCCLETLYQ